ncbi:MAG: DUF1553 domain-containing protein [Planctomycetes bacterium]|nr:DUF1553 domain-containing protein [Planctomycetota bacterium]
MLLALLLPLLTPAAQLPVDQKPVDFQRQVRPILAKNCLACHGGDESTREAKMRLDLRSEATKLRDDEYAIIVPGSAEESELIFRVRDTLDPMPPKKTGHHLSEEQIQLLERWINEGAEYTPHWAFQKPHKADPPPLPVGMRQSDANAIDAFIYEQVVAAGLSPAPRADRRTLIRRLSLDLIGLPPTPQEVDNFVNDLNPGAYERVVDRLLASSHFGERWAAVWLDLARYADSKGHGSDPLRQIWRYRDWVIEAINNDMPFDEFTLQQMAGDLMPNATTEQNLATAFHRNSLVNTEGGTDDEEFRVAAIKDRINLSMQVWMGLTFGCAECHTHKFDPITHEDYYSAFAIFNQTADTDKNDDSPKIDTPTREQQAQLRSLHKELTQLSQRMEKMPIDESALLQWRQKARAEQQSWKRWTPPQAPVSGHALTYKLATDGSALLTSPASDKDGLSLQLEYADSAPTGIRLQALTDDSLPRSGPGASPNNGNFVLSEASLHWKPDSKRLDIAALDSSSGMRGRYVRLSLPGMQRIFSLAEVEVFSGANNIAPSGEAAQSSVAYEGEAKRAIDGITDGDYFRSNSVTHTQTEDNPWWELDLGSEQMVEMLRIWNRTDGNQQARLNGLQIELLDAERNLVSSQWQRMAPEKSSEWQPALGGQIRIQTAVASFEQTDYSAAMAVDGDPQTGWAIAPRQGQAHELHLYFQCPPGAGLLQLSLEQNYGAQHILGRIAATWTDQPTPPQLLPPDVAIALASSATEQPILRQYFRSFDPGIAALRKRSAEINKQIERMAIPQTPVLVALAADQRRQTYVLEKGNFLNPLQEVQARVPAAFKWGDGAVADRKEFAAWLTHADNPVTPRVQVNRLWSRLFGRGLVSTEEDFGAQGALPTHEALLDWLAVDYASHWSLKRFLKTVVTSATYRQSSRTLPIHLQKDPDNVLLSRGPRFRLPAEAVRDQALQVSGLLSRKIGGPSVFPPQPGGLWQAAFNGERDWKTSEGEDRWRRGIYTFLRRSTPYPSMVVFDAPSREICTIRRIRTNTPLQAFVTLNDPVYVECAQALARRMLGTKADDRQRVRAAYQLCMARPPSSQIVEILAELLQEQREHYKSHPQDAVVMASDPLGPLLEDADVIDHAAWTVVANVLLNMDEFLNKD